MKRRTRAKRRNRMLKADRVVEKLQLQYKGSKGDVFSRPDVKRAMRKLEHAIDKLPRFHQPHKW